MLPIAYNHVQLRLICGVGAEVAGDLAGRAKAERSLMWKGTAPVGIKALIAEDDDGIRETLNDLLADAGYEVEEAADGVMALDMLRRVVGPYVALIDLAMPGLSGIEVLRAFATEMADAAPLARRQFILLTARQAPLPDDDAELLTTLQTPIVYKPFDIDDVLAMVEASARRLSGGSGA